MGMGGWELGWVVVCHGSLGPFHNTIPNSNTNEGGVRDTKSIPIVIFLIHMIHKVNIGGGWFGMGLGCHVTRIPWPWVDEFL